MAQQNAFSNDGSFLAQFMQQQQQPTGGEAGTNGAQVASGADGGAQQQQATAADYSQYYADYAAYYGGYGASAYGAYGGYPGYDQQQQQHGHMQPGMQGGGYGGGGYGGGGGGGYGRPPMRSEEKPSRSLWVGNVHPESTENELHAIFQQYGPIESVRVIVHKSCAFVVYNDLESATEAYNALAYHRPYLREQELRIGWGKADTREHVRREQRDDDAGPRSKNLWIGGLGPDVYEEDVREKFRPYGHIEHIKLLPEKKCGFVNFDNVESAVRARRELQGQYIRGRPMRINYGRIEGDDRPSSAPAPYQREPAPAPVSVPPRQPVPPPADPAIRNVIEKTAEYVKRNGAEFERMMRERERNNPKLQFLFEGNEHNPYYEWKLYCLTNPDADGGGGGGGGAHHVPASASSYGYQDQMPASTGPLSAQDRAQLGPLLAGLDGTKDTIMAGKDWIFQHWGQAVAIADDLRAHVERSLDWDKKLLTLYLVNDVLHHALAQRTDPSAVDALSEAFKLPAVFMFRSAYHGQTPERQDKVIKLLRLWESRNIYGATTIQRMEQAILSLTPPAEPPHTLNTTGVPPPAMGAAMGMATNPAMAATAQLAYGYLQQQQQQAYPGAGAYGVGAAAQMSGMMAAQQVQQAQGAYNSQPYDYGQQQQQLEAGRKRRRSPSPERGHDAYDRDPERRRDDDRGSSRDRDRERRDSGRRSGWDS